MPNVVSVELIVPLTRERAEHRAVCVCVCVCGGGVHNAYKKCTYQYMYMLLNK